MANASGGYYKSDVLNRNTFVCERDEREVFIPTQVLKGNDMQTQKLFTYAVLLHPTEAEKEDGGETKLIVPPTHDLAKDETTLRTKAALSIPKEYQDVLNRVEIIVRPF